MHARLTRFWGFWLALSSVQRRLIVFGAIGVSACVLAQVSKTFHLTGIAFFGLGIVLVMLAAGIGVPLVLLPEEQEEDAENKISR